MEERRMGILEHLEELRKRLFLILWIFMPVFIFYMTFTIRFVDVGGIPLPYPWLDFFNAISVHFVRLIMDSLLPTFVERVQFNPWEAILVQVKVAVFLALLTTMPFMVYQLSKFVAPGLYTHEKRIILRITIPATLLFGLGVVVAYLWILPFTFQFLYGVGVRMGLTPFVGPDQFFDMVLLFLVGMGIGFQTPVIMWGLTALGIVNPDFWKRNWRYAVVAFFIFGAVITPDGSGVTMLLVALPMVFLYAGGYVIAHRNWNQRQGGPPPETGRSSLPVWSAVVILVAAVIGGSLYYNQALFQPPTGIADVPVEGGQGEFTVALPAFVLFVSPPARQGIHTGALLRATNATTVGFHWSAMPIQGLSVGFETASTPSPAIEVVDGGAGLRVAPALWTAPDVTSLELSVTDGGALAYTLELTVAYRLLQRQSFSDANRNGVLDPGEAILQRGYIVNYTLVPGPARQDDPTALGIAAPSNQQALPLKKVLLSTVGPGWVISAAAQDFPDFSGPFEFVIRVDSGLEALGLTLFLTRSYAWSGDEDQSVWIRGDVSAQFTYLWLLDLRFGTLSPGFDSP